MGLFARLRPRTTHWQRLYEQSDVTRVGWYREELTLSRELIHRFAPEKSAGIIDIGAGASTLVDSLLADGYGALTLLDISEAALEAARQRLGQAQADAAQWIAADLTAWTPPARYDLWHDRAVFHFLTRQTEREAYLRALEAGLAPEGTAVIATFAADGPKSCAGLPVVRYDRDAMQRTIGAGFTVTECHSEQHRTPVNSVQPFNYFVLQRATQ